MQNITDLSNVWTYPSVCIKRPVLFAIETLLTSLRGGGKKLECEMLETRKG